MKSQRGQEPRWHRGKMTGRTVTRVAVANEGEGHTVSTVPGE